LKLPQRLEGSKLKSLKTIFFEPLSLRGRHKEFVFGQSETFGAGNERNKEKSSRELGIEKLPEFISQLL